MTRARRPVPLLVGLAVVLAVLVFAATQVRLIDVQGQRAVGWAWQRGEVAFTNSITGRPVRIQFALREPFSDFRMITDPDTEGYYTGGEYAINDRLRHEHTRQLDYCSMVGMHLTIGAHAWNIKQQCLTARILWPPG